MKKSTKLTLIWLRTLMAVVFITGALGTLFNKDQSAKSEYLFICTQATWFLIVSFLPNLLKKTELDIPDVIYIIFILFCLAHYFLGEILGFYVKIKWWDSFLHTFSGMLLCLLSFSLINILNNNTKDFKLNIGFMALFAFCMTITIGVLWEIYEFANDCISGSNMQRAYVSTMNGRGEPLVGQAALTDTMKDLILDSIGAGVVCILCIIGVCTKKLKVENLAFIKKKEKKSSIQDKNKPKNKAPETPLSINENITETSSSIEPITQPTNLDTQQIEQPLQTNQETNEQNLQSSQETNEQSLQEEQPLQIEPLDSGLENILSIPNASNHKKSKNNSIKNAKK